MQSLDLTTALPELFLAVSASLLLMIGVFKKEKPLRLILALSVLVLLVALGMIALGPKGGDTAFEGLFLRDTFADFMKELVLIGALLTMILTVNYAEREGMDRFELPILMLFATLGMMVMVSAGNLLSLYLGLELQSLSLYVIAALRREDLRSSEAGLKYFVLGALSSGMLLYGCSLIYGFTGTTEFAQLAHLFASAEASPGLILRVVLLITGLAFKLSAVPFHMWTPDVYEGAPTPITAFFATAPKVAAMALFIRVAVGPFGGLSDQWQQIVIFMSIASMVIGALAALVQTNIKRLMAYSSIGHVGYALVGLAAGSEQGIRGVAIYLAIYVFMNVGTFACILSMRRSGQMVEGIEDLKGLAKTQPLMAAALAVFMFSMAGIPPLAGFFGKFFVFMAAINEGLVTLAVIGVVSSVVGAFYYLRIVKFMYFDDSDEAFDRPIAREVGVILIGTSLVILVFWALPGTLVDGASAAAASLVGA
ncbi:MAG: NADH-quinone oxidoreductase subunit NuoN [Kiloniellales bacterium]|nr:NADH-quinone oxidoreductase subunit NuoN [Kiloniellales bacterium]